MAMHGQPSAPSFHADHAHTDHALWRESPDNVPPLFDYELYRQSRSRDPSFKLEQIDYAARMSGDQGCQSLASMVNSYYDSPHDHMGMHRYRTAPGHGNPSVGPPLQMTGGGYENPIQKANKQHYGGKWNCAPQQSLPQRRSSQRELEARFQEEQEQQQQQHTPVLSVAIAVVNVVILILTMQQNDCPDHTTAACLSPYLHKFAFQPFRENPLLGPSAKTLLSMGALESDLVTKAREGWRVVSAMWLHAGVLQIMGTCVGMLVLGLPLERQLGFAKVGGIYVASGVMGSILSALMVRGRVSVGATGALMGLVGATLASVVVTWRQQARRTAALMAVVVMAVLATVYGLMPFADNFMHVGGAVTGLLVGNVVLIRPHSWRCWQSSAVFDQDDMPAKRNKAVVLDIVWLLSLATLLTVSILALYGLFSGKDMTDGCWWCQFLACAPSRFWTCADNQQLPCNPTSMAGLLRITCPNGQVLDFSSVTYATKITPHIQALCVKACV